MFFIMLERKIKSEIKKNKKLRLNTKSNFFLFFAVVFLFLIDIFTKYFFDGKNYLENNFLYIASSHNTGSAFSIFSSVLFYNYAIAILGLVCASFLVYYKEEFIENNFLRNVWILIIAGILGNSYDRLLLGYTRDFLGFFEFFIFNLADFYLTIAVILYFIYEYRQIDKNY